MSDEAPAAPDAAAAGASPAAPAAGPRSTVLMPPLPAGRPIRVLSLSGGGFLGLYSATVLEGLEARAGMPLGRCFDLIAGTSIGGLLSLALAYEVPMSRLVRLFVDHGPEVFSSRALPSGAVSRLLDLSRSVFGPKYSGEALRRALQSVLGDVRLADAAHRVVVPAVDVGRCRTKIFKTPHAPTSRGDGTLRAVDVAMATCAAPAYFPGVRVGRRLFADGGLYAVAPDQVALHELEHFMGIDLGRVSMLSIGTATSHYKPAEGVTDDAGAVEWMSRGRLILTLISVQQQHVYAMVQDRLGDERYLRLDATWPSEAGLGIDVATRKATEVLTALGRQTLAEAPRQLDAFLKPAERRASPRA
ncbi:MAG: patatin-like phospholipase family protein [Rhizobacter sp.]|nr:patatin-like phospholipase family protein [Rhizobacter sp.]